MTLKDAIAAASLNHDAVAPASAALDDLTAKRNAAVDALNVATKADTTSNDFLSSVLPNDGKIRSTPKSGEFVLLVDGKAQFFKDGGDGSDITVPDAPGGVVTSPTTTPVSPPDIPPAPVAPSPDASSGSDLSGTVVPVVDTVTS